MELTLQILAREGMADDTDRADSIQPGARFVPEPGTSPATTYRLVSNMRDFQSLEHDWNALFERLDSPTAFQAFDWNRLWSETYIDAGARRCRLAVMTAWRADRLILVLPCVQEKHAGISRLKWMGEPVTQYGDVLVDDVPDAQEVVAAAWNEVVRLLRPDAAWLRFVRGDAAIAPLLRRLNALEVAPRRAPYLELPRDASADQFLLRYGSKNRKNRRRQMRRLQEQGTVEFAVAGIGPSAVAISRDTLALKHRWLAQRRTYSTAFA
ncbi:MAG: hypothetical protein RLZ98_3277, partial [Pseudomonadota bacterium]